MWVGFLAAALSDDDLAARHVANNRAFLGRVERLVAACRPDWPQHRQAVTAKRLVAMVEGLNALPCADPVANSPEAQQAAIDEATDQLVPGA